ncbi:iron chelate uptake ABC transporter family permease subunit [Lacrimispora xylanisolvens]|uniref:iron chelate uptake ABC transporter family permease subunit n=1 Tax=Lacrimispora xylanisolvens TaxID=384636 RepID=UPI003D9CBE78
MSILVGVKNISFLHPSLEDMEIIFISRFPRLVSILVAGCSLSMTGLIMQTITKNKFVSPTTAGTADWARLGILIAMLFFGNSSTMIKMLVAFVSCMFGSFLFIRLLTKIRIRNGILIPLIGLMIGNIVEAVATFFAYRFDLIQNMSSWMQGSFSLILKGRYELLYVGIPFLILGYLYADKFTIAGMGKDFSMNLGLNHEQIVNLGLVLVSVITSVVTVTVGGLPFLDLIVPNIMSMIKGDNLKQSAGHCAPWRQFYSFLRHTGQNSDLSLRNSHWHDDQRNGKCRFSYYGTEGSKEMTRKLIRGRTDKRAAACLMILAVVAAIAILLFIFQGLNQNNFDFNFPRRMKKIAAMILVSICVGYSSVVFQTMTESKILTPGVMGLDSLYLFIQSFIVYLMGAEKLMRMNSSLHFIISVGAMMAASLIIYRLVFRADGFNIYTLVLAGMIMGTFFRGISSFLQLLIDPNEFSILQGSLFASFRNINEKLLSVSCIIVAGSLFFTRKDISRFDVLGLSKDNAISLGIYYDSLIKRTMLVISALTAVSTVLVGPVTFFGNPSCQSFQRDTKNLPPQVSDSRRCIYRHHFPSNGSVYF